MRNKLFILLLVSLLCVSCVSKNKKLETHPTGETNQLEALDKFWDLLKPLRVIKGAGAIDFN
jgi:hypothetical protein